MKKSILLLMLALLFLLFSCEVASPGAASSDKSKEESSGDESSAEPTLKVITNITQGSRALENTDVSEVLLRFHSDGLFEGKSDFTLDDPCAFYVDYIGEDESYHTDYGMSFNTVLYVPDVIRTVYDDMGGKDPDSGNPFWWYMSTFLSKDLTEIRSSWKESVEELLGEEGKALPYPKKGNTTDEKWRKRSSFIMYSAYYFSGNSVSPVRKPLYEYLNMGKNWDGMMLYLPASLVETYLERGGDYINNTEAFYWYMSKYKGVERDEIDRMVKEGELEDYLKKLEYTAPADGDGVTVDELCHTVVATNITNQENGKGKKLMAVYSYGENNILQFKDGRLVTDRDRLYFVNSGPDDFICFVPESFSEKLESEGYTLDAGTGALFWNLLTAFGLSEDGEGYKKDGDSSYLTREYIEKNILTKGIDDISGSGV